MKLAANVAPPGGLGMKLLVTLATEDGELLGLGPGGRPLLVPGALRLEGPLGRASGGRLIQINDFLTSCSTLIYFSLEKMVNLSSKD